MINMFFLVQKGIVHFQRFCHEDWKKNNVRTRLYHYSQTMVSDFKTRNYRALDYQKYLYYQNFK